MVVGAGPAGAAAAITAKRLRPSWDIVLLDKASFPRDKPCGDGLAPHAVSELDELGAADVIADAPPVRSVVLRSPKGTTVKGSVVRPGYVVRRWVFDAHLVEVARRIGVEVLRERVDFLEQLGCSVQVNGTWTAPFVVAADGANSRCRRVLGLRQPPPGCLAFAVRGYKTSVSNEFIIRWEKHLAPSYSWEFPLGDGTANVGFGHFFTDGAGGRSKAVLWEAAADFCGIDPTSPTLRAHFLPLSSGRLERSCGRVLFCGDAAGLINPLSGEGIYYALASGRFAGTAIATALAPSEDYERRIATTFGAHFRSTSRMNRVIRKGRWLEAGLRAAADDEAIFGILVEIALGAGTWQQRMASATVRHWLWQPPSAPVPPPGGLELVAAAE